MSVTVVLPPQVPEMLPFPEELAPAQQVLPSHRASS